MMCQGRKTKGGDHLHPHHGLFQKKEEGGRDIRDVHVLIQEVPVAVVAVALQVGVIVAVPILDDLRQIQESRNQEKDQTVRIVIGVGGITEGVVLNRDHNNVICKQPRLNK